jgi:acetolactate synthase I/II/III large subunit
MTHKAPDPKLTASSRFVTLKDDKTVAQLLLDYLALEGVTKLFGIPGGAVIFIINELKKRRDAFDFLVCRHETGAAYIAHGYARVTGGLGVVLTTAGPSATNALTGSMNAQAANCAVLTITGEIPQLYFGEGYLQEGVDARLDVGVIYRNAVEYSVVISSEKNFATLFQQALREARSQPPRATHVSLPNDVAGTCVTGDDKDHPYRFAFPTSPDRYRTVPTCSDPDRVQLTFGELAAATRPLLFLGDGARHALRDLDRLHRFTQLVEKFAFPVMTTPDGKGIFPERHELSLRNYGMTACTWPDLYIKQPQDPDHYDALLVLGSSLGELATTVVAKDHYSKNLIPTSHFVQVELDQSVIGRDFPITRGIVADIGSTIDALWEFGRHQQPDPTKTEARRQIIAEIKGNNSPFANPQYRASNDHPTNPAALVRVINETVTEGHIFIDAGNCVGWSLNNFVIDPPLHYHSALGMGPMGFGVAAVVGGKVGAPDQTCIALVGDGAFMMHGAEVSTAAQNGVGAIWVVLNDNDLSMVSQGMADLFPPPGPWTDYYKLGAPDLVKFSEGLGAQAVAIKQDQGPAEFATALKTAIRQAAEGNRPQVIVAHIDTAPTPPYGWPKVPAAPCHKDSSDTT